MSTRSFRPFAAAAVIALSAAGASSAPESVTFNTDVLPLLQKNCQTCHRAGEVAPMKFTSYEETRPWAKAIKQAVLTRKMPPWFADPQYGHFLLRGTTDHGAQRHEAERDGTLRQFGEQQVQSQSGQARVVGRSDLGRDDGSVVR